MKILLLFLALICGGELSAQENLALHRQAWASTSYDYNMTAQLVTDGICDDTPLTALRVCTPQGPLNRREREWAIDGNPWSHHVLTGDSTWLQFDWSGRQNIVASRVVIDARLAYRPEAKGYRISCQISDDGVQWNTIGCVMADKLPGRPLRYMVHSDPNKQTDGDMVPARTVSMEVPFDGGRIAFRHFRVMLQTGGCVYWMVYDVHFFDGEREFWPLSSEQFCSAWMSDGGGEQWLRVDLGGPSVIDSIVPRWVEQPRRWHAEIAADGSQVTIVMQEPGPSGYYAMREIEVRGVREELTLRPSLQWQLQRASEVKATGEKISLMGFDTRGWVNATVPGTVLASYINIGAVPDPNYADNIDQISESFFRSNFWYRGTLRVAKKQGRQLLCFDGVNWKANVFLNGQRLGRIEGAFQRVQFDVSRLLCEGDNYVAVEIECNEHFGAVKEKDANTTQFNGGLLGADNPTFHASIGWDWITTVRGREAGIWNTVSLRQIAGEIVLSDPYVQTTLSKDSRQVMVTPAVFAKNLSEEPLSGVLRGWIGDVTFEQPISLPPHTEREVVFRPVDHPQLCRSDFRLWWPNGYGTPFLYDAGFCMTDGDTLRYKAGLRQMTYLDEDDSLRIYINGRRFVPLGGNWGFPEHNLQYGKQAYDAAVGYHRDMHCTMIRNWVGQTGHRAFYDACDSLGIMVWQDFWLANLADGPDPLDERLFLNNAEDYVRRIRQHPSIGIYCGRNEGFPPKTIDGGLRRYVATLAPGLGYISSSADGGVTGHGPYCAQSARVYFQRQTGKIHTERGMPAVMNIESLQRMLSPDCLWPQSVQWGQHDYTLSGAQRASEFNALVEQTFGHSADAGQFARRAQFINYEGYRAMFESGSRTRSGLLIWMSHSCWPSIVWQTYDYYLDPTAAYFGVKKACEPLHIQMNALTDSVEVVNLFAGKRQHLKAVATVYDLNGRQLWKKQQLVDSPDDSTMPVMGVVKEGQGVRLLRLQLIENGMVVSENDYFLPDADNSCRELLSLPVPRLLKRMSFSNEGRQRIATVSLTNTGDTIAPFLRLNMKDAEGHQILPVIYSDNYFSLLPGEHRTVTVRWPDRVDYTGEPVIEVAAIGE